MDQETLTTLLIIGALLLIGGVIYWMVTILNRQQKQTIYLHMQIQLLKKLLEKQGEQVNLDELFSSSSKSNS